MDDVYNSQQKENDQVPNKHAQGFEETQQMLNNYAIKDHQENHSTVNRQVIDMIADTRVQAAFREIYERQLLIFGYDFLNIDAMVKEYVSLIHEEAEEAKKEVNAKRHKPKKIVNMKLLQKEVIDIVIYAFAISGLVFQGRFEDMIDCLEEKNKENRNRDDWKEEYRNG